MLLIPFTCRVSAKKIARSCSKKWFMGTAEEFIALNVQFINKHIAQNVTEMCVSVPSFLVFLPIQFVSQNKNMPS